MVEDLLESPHFGERWAIPWMDLARYADSAGYERDPLRPHAWRWRHWLIDAINRDMPFDRFTIEQIAGDLLPGATVEQRVATGFLRNGIKNREAGTKNDQKRFEETVDRLNTVANTWLGLTVGCAQCHDHKYDPLSQKEFYAMFAFFHNAVERDIEAPMPGELGPYLRTVQAHRAGLESIREEHGIPALQAEWHERMLAAMDNPGVRTDWGPLRNRMARGQRQGRLAAQGASRSAYRPRAREDRRMVSPPQRARPCQGRRGDGAPQEGPPGSRCAGTAGV